jgi:hypothetical protein
MSMGGGDERSLEIEMRLEEEVGRGLRQTENGSPAVDSSES